MSGTDPGPQSAAPAQRASTALPADCDLLVVGGGVNGAGIARDAAGRGLRVVLVEQHDLASHTSRLAPS
jgi:glycerol-3-phosphate dehydrogenase